MCAVVSGFSLCLRRLSSLRTNEPSFLAATYFDLKKCDAIDTNLKTHSNCKDHSVLGNTRVFDVKVSAVLAVFEAVICCSR